MAKKVINADQLQSIKAKLDDFTGEIKDGIDFVEDDSKAYFENGNSEIKNTTSGITDTISNLNDYLDNVAMIFKDKDNELSVEISESRIESTPSETSQSAEYQKVSQY